MVGGQVVDLQAAGQVRGHAIAIDPESLRGMHLRKTGALITAAAASGAIMTGADDPLLDAIESWAREIGLAFQIVDDILDVEGHAEELGKTAGKDAAARKLTYPALYGLEQSREMARECRERARSILTGSHLENSWLDAIADWVVSRRS
jgi:geranylgeranyl diphosphate synthase type II